MGKDVILKIRVQGDEKWICLYYLTNRRKFFGQCYMTTEGLGVEVGSGEWIGSLDVLGLSITSRREPIEVL